MRRRQFDRDCIGFKFRISNSCLLISAIVLCHPSAFSSPLILRGYQPLIDLVREDMPSLTFGPSRLGSVKYSCMGFSVVPLRNAVVFSPSTSVFHPPKFGLVSWPSLNGLVSFPVIIPVVVMDLPRVFVFFGDGALGIRIDLSRGAVFHRPVLHLYIC